MVGIVSCPLMFTVPDTNACKESARASFVSLCVVKYGIVLVDNCVFTCTSGDFSFAGVSFFASGLASCVVAEGVTSGVSIGFSSFSDIVFLSVIDLEVRIRSL